MRRLNLNFLISLMIGTAVLLAGVHLLRTYNLKPSITVLLTRANEAQSKKDLRSALGYLLEYLKHEPDDNQQLANAAQLAAEIAHSPSGQQNDWHFADKLLEKALRQDELRQRADLRRKLVGIEILEQQYDEARNNINILSDNGVSDANLDFDYARCSFLRSYFDDAIAKLQKLVGYNSKTKKFDSKHATAPGNIDAYRLLASIYREHKQLNDAADEVVNQMVKCNPKSSLAHQARCTYLRRYHLGGSIQQNLATIADAKEELRKALEIDPDNVDVLLQCAEVDWWGRDFESAKRHLVHALKVNDKDPRVYLQLSLMMLLQKDLKGAVDYVQQGLAKLPNNEDLLWELCDYQIQQKDFEGARKTVHRMTDAMVLPEKVTLANAHILMAEQNWVQAVRELEAVRPRLGAEPQVGDVEVTRRQEGTENPDEAAQRLRTDPRLATMADRFLGRCYQMLRQPDRELAAYTRALQANSRSPEALQGKATALAALGRYKEALDTYQQGLEPAIGERAFASDKELMAAKHQVIAALLQRDPSSSYLQKLEEHVRQQMERIGTGTVESLLYQVNDLARDRKYDEAATLLEQVIASNPPDLRLRIAQVKIIAEQKGVEAGLARLADVEHDLGDSMDVRLTRGELLLRQGNPNVKQQIAALEQGIDKFKRAEQVEMWTRLGLMYFRLGSTSRDDVRRCWQRALELNPGNTTVMEWLCEVAGESGDYAAIVKARDDMEKAFGRGSSQWDYAEAMRLVAQVKEHGAQADPKALDTAWDLTQRAANLRPEWQTLIRLQAEIEDIKGNYDGAMRDYERSLDLGSPNTATVQRLIQLQLDHGQTREALRTLERIGPTAPGMERIAMLVYTLAGEADKALDAINAAVPDSAKEAPDFLLKGQMLLRIQKNDLAEDAFRQAVKLGPQLSQTWLALVEFLVRVGKPAEAERIIRDAENELTDDQTPLVLGQCYTLLGNYEQAEQYYLMALDARPHSLAVQRAVAAFYLKIQQPMKAIPQLKAIVEAAPRIGRDDLPHVMWARRELADVLSRSMSYPWFQLAVRLVEDNATSGTLSAMDRLLLARLYGSRNDPASLHTALTLLDQLQRQKPLDFEGRRLLAQVYFKTKQLEKCRSLLMDLIAEEPNNPSVIVALASSLMTSGEIQEAAPWVRRLQEMQPKAEETVRLAARLAALSNRPNEAISIVDSVLPAEITSRDVGQLVAAAQLLEEFKIYPEAEKKFRKAAGISLQGKLALAQFLARSGRTDECFEILRTDVAPVAPSVACQVGYAALRKVKDLGSPIPLLHRDQMSAWFDQAMHTRGSIDVGVLVERASFLEMLGQPDQAAQIYSQLLSNAKLPEIERAQVANNLAYLLAVAGTRLDEAMKLSDYSIKQLGPLPKLIDTRAMVLMADGNFQKAKDELTDATEFVDDPVMLFHLALAYQKLDDRASADRLRQRAHDGGLRKQGLPAVEGQRLDELDRWLAS